MASQNSDLLHCYNKGCGMKFDPKDNKEDSCYFHPGNPVFHDAYKGWSCCNKKSIDFTEFLNLKGCTISFHSNVKPPEPEKPIIKKPEPDEVYEYRAPAPKVPRERPPFDTPLTRITPERNVMKTDSESSPIKQPSDSISEIQVGTICKNSGCKATYEGPQSMTTDCIHHSGVPVFHEGLKYWSCCKKKNTDFSAFLDQKGCTTGQHLWVKEKSVNRQSNCRYDWHQTGTDVVLSIYAKKYDPEKSFIEVSPIRAKIHIEFPAEGTQFDKDLELHGIIDVEKSKVSMLQTKVEVTFKKAEPGSWSKLDVPLLTAGGDENKTDSATKDMDKTLQCDKDDAVDLSDIK